jgi:hypothetical protein
MKHYWLLVLLAASTAAVIADANCDGNACKDLQYSYVGKAPTGCHTLKNIGTRTFHYTWGSNFSNDLGPGQSNVIANFNGACLQYVAGRRTAVYK